MDAVIPNDELHWKRYATKEITIGAEYQDLLLRS